MGEEMRSDLLHGLFTAIASPAAMAAADWYGESHLEAGQELPCIILLRKVSVSTEFPCSVLAARMVSLEQKYLA